MPYFKSEKVKVFPCSYRGYKENQANQNNEDMIDPESRMITESNYANATGFNFYNMNATTDRGLSDTYILNYSTTNHILKVVINGYYFEIDLTDYQPINWQYLYINVGQIAIAEDITTNVLKTVDDPSTLNLDQEVTIDSTTEVFFKGLLYSDSKIENSPWKELKVFNKDVVPESDPVEYEYNLNTKAQRIQLKLDDLNAESGHIVTSADSDTGSKAITGDKDFTGDVSIKSIINDPILAQGKEIQRTMKETNAGSTYVAREVVVPDYNDAQANNVLSVNASGTGLEWRIPYNTDLQNDDRP